MRPRRESLLLQSINCRWTTFLIIALHVIQPDVFRESDDIINSYSKKTVRIYPGFSIEISGQSGMRFASSSLTLFVYDLFSITVNDI